LELQQEIQQIAQQQGQMADKDMGFDARRTEMKDGAAAVVGYHSRKEILLPGSLLRWIAINTVAWPTEIPWSRLPPTRSKKGNQAQLLGQAILQGHITEILTPIYGHTANLVPQVGQVCYIDG
jgi:hypothetical protein